MNNDSFKEVPVPNLARITISPDAMAQIATHFPQTPERIAKEQRIAAARHRLAGQVLAQGRYPSAPLTAVRTLMPPTPDAEIVGLGTSFDGRLIVDWISPDHQHAVTVESPTGTDTAIDFATLPDGSDYAAPLPDGNWLAVAARTERGDDGDPRDNAWIVAPGGEVLTSALVGDALLRPVVGTNGTIWISYFDEGDAEMNVFDSSLRQIGTHSIPDSYVCEVYADHTDGETYWYVSYPDWEAFTWSAEGQGETIAPSHHKGAPIIAAAGKVARFGGADELRDALFLQRPDGGETIVLVTFPDGSVLNRGSIATYGPYLHYLDGLDWYRVNVFGDHHADGVAG